MSTPTTKTVTVALDVHKASVRLAAVRADELLDERTLPCDHAAVGRAVSRWPGARVCYEAGPTGFGLYRHLTGRGIAGEVVAPGLVPARPGERVKTDPRDARKLARLHAGDLLESIWVPSRELEAARALVRVREDASLDRMRARHRLSKFLLRHGCPDSARTSTAYVPIALRVAVSTQNGGPGRAVVRLRINTRSRRRPRHRLVRWMTARRSVLVLHNSSTGEGPRSRAGTRLLPVSMKTGRLSSGGR